MTDEFGSNVFKQKIEQKRLAIKQNMTSTP